MAQAVIKVIGNAILTVFGASSAVATGLAYAAATALVYVGQAIALTKVSQLLGPKAPKVRDFPADVEYSDTMASRRILYGENKVAGMNVIPPLVTGSDGEYLHQVIAIAGHEVNAIGTVSFDKTALTLDGSGNVTGGAFNGKATIRKYTGTSTQTVDGILNSALAEWTSDHRGRGVAYLALRYQFDAEVYRSGKPDVTAIVQGKKCYDPRLDTSPGANPTDATYAAYTTNPALCLADYLLASYGLSEAASRVDWALVVSAANICDEDVSIPGSTTQKRFTCNLVLDAVSAYETNIEALALAMMGTCYYSGGKWRMYAGAWSSSAFTITADNVIGELSIQTAASRKSDGYYNAVRGRFIDKDRDYQPLEFEPILNSTYETQDGNERIYTEVDFPACNNQYEAQRNAIILSKQSRRQKTVTVVCDFSAYKVRPWETGVATIAEVGWSSQPVRCVGWRFRPEPAIELTLQEVASTDYDDPDPGDYVTPASVSTTNPAAYRPGTPQSFTATQEIESILLQWQAPTNTVPGVLYRLYEHTASTPFSSATLIYEGADTQHRVPRTDTNTRYYWVRSFYRGSGGQSDETPSGAGLSSSGRVATMSAYLTNEAIALEADSSGTVSTFAPAVGFFKVFSGSTDVTSSATFAEVSETDVTGDINTADDTPVAGQVKGYYRVTALTADTGTYTISATYGGATITKDFTVTKVRDGVDGLTANIFLTVTGLAIPADNDGSNPVFTNASTTVTVYEGQVDESANWSVTASPSTGITGSLVGKTYTLTGMTVDTGYVEFTATRSGYSNLVVRLSVTKVRAGATGPEGPAGDVGGFSAVLSTDAVTLMAYADGTVISFAPAFGQFSVFLGQENLTGSAVFTANAIDCTGTINTAADTPVSGKPKGYYEVTAMAADTASLELTASLSTNLGTILMEDDFRILQEDGTSVLQTEGSFSITKVFSLAKSRVGYDIVSTLPSTNLFEGRIVFLTTDDKLYRYDGTQWTTAVPVADLTGQILEAQIADAAISTAKFASGLRPVEIVGSLPAAGTQGRVVFLTTDGKLYRDDGSNWTAAVPAADISGTLQDAQIAALAASKITGQLTNTQIADVAAAKLTGTITTTQIGDDSISTAKLQAASITTAKIATGAITSDTIAANTITAADIAFGTITGDRISSNTITASQIASNTITANEIAANTITSAQIAAGTITANEIASNTITAGQIASGAINTDELAANAVNASKIAAGTITATQIASNTITAAQIASSAITADELAANAVTADKIFAGAVTAAKISVTDLAAINANMGNITAGTIVLPSGGFIRSGQTAFDTGTGFYLGNDSGTPKFSIGNASGKNIKWDGSDFTVNGGIITTGSVANNAITEVDYDYNSATTNVGGTWVDVTSTATVNYPGTGVVVVEGIAQIEANAGLISDPGSIAYYYVEFRLLRDGTEIHSLKMADPSWFESSGFWTLNIERSGTIKFYDVPSSGNRSYKLQARVQASGIVLLADVSKALVVAQVFKK